MTLAAREELYARLVEVLGQAPALTLMSYLPDQPATRSDLEATEARLTLRMDHLEQRMDRLEQRMDRLEQRIDNLYELVQQMSDRFHSELRTQTRMFILASLGSTITFGAAVIGAAAVL